MRRRNVPAFVIVLILVAPVLARSFRATTDSQASQAPPMASGQPVFVAADDLTWTDLDPAAAPGVKVADLWGDHASGAYGAYFKLPAGFVVPLHSHTYAMKVIFVSGTYIQTPEGKADVRLGPGSYMLQPGGSYRHVTACDKDAPCVFFVESEGKFDLLIAEGKAPAPQ